MKRTVVILIIVVVVVLLALPKIRTYFSTEATMAGPAAAQSLPVEAIIVKPESFERKLTVTGSILPSESIELKSEVSGKIVGIYFQESQKVKKGQQLVKINDDELVSQLQKQKYNQKLYRDNEYRQRKLLEKEAISQEEYDNALNRLNTTIADIRILEAQLAKTTIVAPFDGFIGFRFVSPGAFVSQSMVIATLYALDPAKIEFSIPARYASRVKIGNKIKFRQESMDSLFFEGDVYAIEPQIDPQTRTLKIRARTPNPQGNLIPGQFINIELILEQLTQALLIPTESIIPIQDGSKIFLYSGGKALEQKVETGERTERKLEILSGIKPGDTVITTGILQLRPGLDLKLTRIN